MKRNTRNSDNSSYTQSVAKTGYEYRKHDYALNKVRKQVIAYRFAVGRIVEITSEDYLLENPDHTHEDFMKWKALSDNDYHEQDKADNRHSYWNFSLDASQNLQNYSATSPLEDEYFEQLEQEETLAHMRSLAKQALELLTEVQHRRYIMHVGHGLSTRKIAAIEGVSQGTVMDSLEQAEKKIKKFIGR